MGPSSTALLSCLVSDLSKVLPSMPYKRLTEPKVRDAIWPGIAPREVAALSLLDSFAKKFADESSEQVDAAALAKFLACNDRCDRSSPIDESDMTEIQSIALGEFRKFIYDFWFQPNRDYWLNPDVICQGMGFGPGSSVGATGTSFYHKVAAGPMTGTRKSLYSLYMREASKYPLWYETEKIRSNHYGGFKEVKGSRLSFVPKSNEISRTICTEPVLNMLVQKGIGSQLELELKRQLGINLSTQPGKNRELARIGSESGAYGTIDLSSASDTISLSLIKRILPPYIVARLMEARSEEVTLPGGEVCRLHMVSSMGNAFTFPLQTILFSSVVMGVYSALNIKVECPCDYLDRFGRLVTKSLGNFAVFGDDIIVRREAYGLVIDLLERLGFLVNQDKSFNDGPFRESCGSDYWDGYNVRGVYCQGLVTKQDVYSLINRLNVWSANHGIPLSETVGLLSKEPGLEFLPVPQWEADDAGIKVPYWLALDSLNEIRTKSFNRRPKIIYSADGVPSKVADVSRYDGSIVYRRYMPRTNPISLLSVESRPQVLKRGRMIHNPAGVLLSAVGGYLRHGEVLLREDITKYLKRLAVAPCWDYCDTSLSNLTREGWHRWKSFCVAINLKMD